MLHFANCKEANTSGTVCGLTTCLNSRRSKSQRFLYTGRKMGSYPVSWAERTRHLMKNSRIEILPRCGHLPPVENLELFNRIVEDFLLSQRA